MEATAPTPPPSEAPRLTGRELDVLRLMCRSDCLLEKEMPVQLGMQLCTFKTHKESLYRKFGVHSRLQLLEKAMRLRVVGCHCCGQLPGREARP